MAETAEHNVNASDSMEPFAPDALLRDNVRLRENRA